MSSICFYFEIHQPLRVDPKADSLETLFTSHEDRLDNFKVLEKVVHKCYLPQTQLILDLLNKYPEFKVSYSLSGTWIDQIEKSFPEVIELLKKLAETGRVEFIDETYFHSLASIYSESEFAEQVALHKKKIQELFGQTPTTFRNTELIYSDHISELVKKSGYKTILAEGADRVLKWKNPNFLFQSTSGINLLLKNYKLSDDIAFKFSDWQSFDFPITADKYSQRVNGINHDKDDVINLFMDYETFGEHQWEVTGIFTFFKDLIEKFYEDNVDFVMPNETSKFKVKDVVSMPDNVSWADLERDTSAWNSNQMQMDSLKEIYSLEKQVKNKGDEKLLKIWRYLLTSDHFYYMSTKNYNGTGDQDVHNYFSPYGTPQKAFEAYQNALKILKSNL